MDKTENDRSRADDSTSPSKTLPRRNCGAADFSLPVLGVGCFSFGGGAYWGAQSQQDVDAVVGRALELGANFFDTAESYNDGASEIALGRALAGRRDRAIVGTKVRPDQAYADVLPRRCEESLKRLGTDHVDVYMLHWPLNPNAMRHYTEDASRLARPPTLEEALGAMDRLRREGKIRHIGISNFGLRQMEEALALGVPIALNELAYNLLMRGIEAEVLPFCERRGLGILGYMSIFQGILSDKFASFDDLAPVRLRTRHFRGDRAGSRHGEPGVESEMMATIEALRAEARGAGVSLPDLALWWAVGEARITCTLVGARNLQQLEHNVDALRHRIDPALRTKLNAITGEVLRKLGPCLDYFQNEKNSRSW
ncbi:MAG: aldo/keto reductase [Opitutaceae bacterium]